MQRRLILDKNPWKTLKNKNSFLDNVFGTATYKSKMSKEKDILHNRSYKTYENDHFFKSRGIDINSVVNFFKEVIDENNTVQKGGFFKKQNGKIIKTDFWKAVAKTPLHVLMEEENSSILSGAYDIAEKMVRKIKTNKIDFKPAVEPKKFYLEDL